MSQTGVRQAQVDALVACYKILDYRVIDPETVVATFHLEQDLVVDVFDFAESEGLITQVQGTMYALTDAGERRLKEIMVRS